MSTAEELRDDAAFCYWSDRGFGTRMANKLIHAGMYTEADLETASWRSLLRVPDFGFISLLEIAERCPSLKVDIAYLRRRVAVRRRTMERWKKIRSKSGN